MASNTENLNLLMKNPSTDGADTFNVQTMLNENWQKIDNNAGTVAKTLANILKPTTPPLIGLPPSATPDGMFQALGNTGELHVWMKTVTTAEEIPAGYTLGAETNTKLCYMYYTEGMSVSYASSVSIDDAGNVSLVSPSSISFNSQDVNNVAITKGKFVKFTATNSSNIATPGVYFIPTDATFTYVMSGTSANQGLYCDKAQKVNTYPLTPAGTTTTYPVSTNPKAYQEGDDAKEAGYTLGDVIKSTGAYGFFGMMGFAYGTSYFQKISDAINVADDGSISHVSPVGDISSSTVLDSASTLKERIAGKYITLSENSYVKQPYTNELPPTNVVLYIPADVNVKMIHPEDTSLSNQYALFFDRYQPVTGYAAIPAGTTIEYLGKLGDKARVQVLSYVGTGTYGSSNPNSLTFDFVPKIVVIQSSTENSKYGSCIVLNGTKQAITYPSTDYTSEFSWNKKTVSWYNQDGSDYQLNKSNAKYTAVAIG